MKKLSTIAISCVLVLCSFNVLAQVEYTYYICEYISKGYKIDLDTSSRTLYIDAMPLDILHEKGGIRLTKERSTDFINTLITAKEKYNEWVKTAKENNVTEINKQMNYTSLTDAYFLFGREWQFHPNVLLTYKFKIIQSKGEPHYLLLINTGKLTSSSNEFMTNDGFVIVFSSIKEIEDFIYIISQKTIEIFLKRQKPEDLFKD